MKTYLLKKFEWSDEKLFTEAACHIFADELLNRLTNQQFGLKRVSLKKECLTKEALHVYVAKGDVMLDITGQHSEQQYVGLKKKEWSKPNDLAAVEVWECDRGELFDSVEQPDDAEKGLRNKWNLHVDEEFVAACRERARSVINYKRQTYGLQ